MAKRLLVYYSYTGNTKIIVDKIKSLIDCDVLELRPVIPFQVEDYQEIVDRYQNNEHAKSIVEIEPIHIDFDQYDQIIIGTSVWWYSMTPIVRAFIKQYPLKGKDIYLFATNAGWLGRTFKEFETTLQGNIKAELNIRFTTTWQQHHYLTKDSEIKKFISQIKNCTN